jgi:putative IMPACT (imprinted ancient) family translation regulator
MNPYLCAVSKYLSIAKVSEGFYKEKGSKFYAFAVPCQTEEEVKAFIQAKRKEHLRIERSEKLAKFNCPDAGSVMLGDMSDSVFNALLAGAEKIYHDKIEAEKQAEITALENSKIELTEKVPIVDATKPIEVPVEKPIEITQ